MEAGREEVLRDLRRLHEEVDREVERLAGEHAGRLRCARGCADCCVDGLTVFQVEAERIRRDRPDILEAGSPRPEGACAFLAADRSCRVYEQRPYVCRTQGVPLRWFHEDESGNSLEYRDICPLNDEGEPIESLSEQSCWTVGPVEGDLAALQERWSGRLERVSLRSLLDKSGD